MKFLPDDVGLIQVLPPKTPDWIETHINSSGFFDVLPVVLSMQALKLNDYPEQLQKERVGRIRFCVPTHLREGRLSLLFVDSMDGVVVNQGELYIDAWWHPLVQEKRQ